MAKSPSSDRGAGVHRGSANQDPWFSTLGSPAGFVSPSLNQVRIVSLPGLELPTDIRDHTGFELLSAAALGRLVMASAPSLALDPELPDLLERFDDCFVSADPGIRGAAGMIAKVFGERLGYLLLTLHRADDVNRLARPQWSDSHWAYWQAVQQVWIAGGLMSGRFGSAALAHAQTILRRNKAHLTVERARHAALLPLLGAARHGLTFSADPSDRDRLAARAPAGHRIVLVMDFGQSKIKRAWAHYRTGRLEALCPLPERPAGCDQMAGGSVTLETLAQQTTAIIDRMAESWPLAGALKTRPEPHIVISLATYLYRGRPCQPHDGCYGRLARLSDDLPAYLETGLSRRLGQAMNLTLLHDGSAAASVYAGTPNAAVIVLGTAMGVGFPGLSEEGLCQVADDLLVTPHFRANEPE